MYINPIGVANYQINRINRNVRVKNPAFQGKHDCAKFFGTLAAGLGTFGAIVGTAIMTGGVSLIPTIAYGSLCGGVGAVGGHLIDKSQNKDNKNS